MNERMKTISVVVAALVAAEARVEATWYSENVADGADIIMMDLRWPWWPSGTYFANWNSGFNPKPNNLSFYAGFTSFLEDGAGSVPNPDVGRQDAFRPGSVWTFWGSDAAGKPVRFEDCAPNLYIRNDYGGEGSSGTTGAEVWRFVKRREWYTMVARVWQVPGEEGTAHVGRWIKDQAGGAWHLIGTARLPVAATSFTGNAGFLEPLTSEKAVRSLHRRFGYYRKGGEWGKSDTIAIDKTQYVVVNAVVEGDHEYAAIEYAQRPDLLPRELSGELLAGDRKHEFRVRQPDRPVLDRPVVAGVKAESCGGETVVSWEVPAAASPMLGVRVEVLGAKGEKRAVTVVERVQPSLRRLVVPGAGGYVRVTVRDVFDQDSEPVTVAVGTVALAAALPEMATVEGLAYEMRVMDGSRRLNYFNPPEQKPDETHRWIGLEEMGQGKLMRQGLARGFDIGLRESRENGYGFVFRGRLRVERDGMYVFRTKIDGAYRLRVGGREVIVRDGQWGTAEQSGWAALARGDHAIELEHVYDALAGRNFAVMWEGAGMKEEVVPVSALRRVDDGGWPVPEVVAEASGDGSGVVRVRVVSRGRKVERTTLFLGALELLAGAGETLEYRGPLPAGANTFRVRVLYDGDRTVDSEPVVLENSGKSVGAPWVLRNVGDAKAAAGMWQSGEGAFQFFGNGMHTVTQRVSGDFTLTCRVDQWNGSGGEPVNGRAWVGLTAREHGERLNWEWGQEFHLVQTAADGLRAAADFTDFGAGRISSYALPKGRPWLRVVRRGQVWTAWTSVDGRDWELGALQYRKAAEEVDAGLFVSALPQDARAHYHCRVSSLELLAGSEAGEVPEVPVAKGTGGDRVSGVVVSRADPRVVVVRTTSGGLRRSEDGGGTWVDANDGLGGEAMAVRSVALHPRDAKVMLRACGRGDRDGGGMWRSRDGGRVWEKLEFPGDFDGVGPSALCGEVVAYDLRDPEVVYAGCESAGFFRSGDGGTTWVSVGLAGERVTAVTVWPWEQHYPAPAQGRTHLCVTTSPDRWMAVLGRGEPVVRTRAVVSRGYLSPDGGKTLVVSDERDDTGFFNVAFDKALQSVNEMRYATAHGYQAQVFAGSQMALYPAAKELEWLRPFTAVGAAAQGEAKFGRMVAQALDPAVRGRVSVSERWGFEWGWQEMRGEVPAGGLVAAVPEVANGREWWLLFSDGLYWSGDGGRTVRRVLDAGGREVGR